MNEVWKKGAQLGSLFLGNMELMKFTRGNQRWEYHVDFVKFFIPL